MGIRCRHRKREPERAPPAAQRCLPVSGRAAVRAGGRATGARTAPPRRSSPAAGNPPSLVHPLVRLERDLKVHYLVLALGEGDGGNLGQVQLGQVCAAGGERVSPAVGAAAGASGQLITPFCSLSSPADCLICFPLAAAAASFFCFSCGAREKGGGVQRRRDTRRSAQGSAPTLTLKSLIIFPSAAAAQSGQGGGAGVQKCGESSSSPFLACCAPPHAHAPAFSSQGWLWANSSCYSILSVCLGVSCTRWRRSAVRECGPREMPIFPKGPLRTGLWLVLAACLAFPAPGAAQTLFETVPDGAAVDAAADAAGGGTCAGAGWRVSGRGAGAGRMSKRTAPSLGLCSARIRRRRPLRLAGPPARPARPQRRV